MGERQRKHHHYLKSALWCDRCHDCGIESRLILSRGHGNGGEYWYFVCHQRLHHECDAPYVRVEDAEEGVLRHYSTLRLPEGLAKTFRETLASTLADEELSARFVHQKLTTTLRELDAKEERLLDLAEGGGLGAAKVRVRLGAIAEERVRLRGELALQRPRLEAGAALIQAALDLLDDPEKLYGRVSNPVRRLPNVAFFEKLYIEDDKIRNEVLREPFDALLYRRWFPGVTAAPKRRAAPAHRNGALVGAGILFDRIARVDGSNKDTMVELNGRYSKRANNPVRDVMVVVLARYGREHQLSKQLQKTRQLLRSVDFERRSAPLLPPRPSFKLAQRLAPAVIDQIVLDYQDGRTTNELVVQYGISHGSVVKVLHQGGVAMRNQGLRPEQIEQAAELYREGMSVARVGKLFDVDGTTAWTALQKAGVVMRPRRGGRKAAQCGVMRDPRNR
jgi:hypothetical protein